MCTGTSTRVQLKPFAFNALMIEKILLKSFGRHGNKPVNTDDDETAAIRAAS